MVGTAHPQATSFPRSAPVSLRADVPTWGSQCRGGLGGARRHRLEREGAVHKAPTPARGVAVDDGSIAQRYHFPPPPFGPPASFLASAVRQRR